MLHTYIKERKRKDRIKMNIIVLAGGLSTERDVSFVSGLRIANALRENGHKALLIDSYTGLDSDKTCEEIFEDSVELSYKVHDIRQKAPDLNEVRNRRKGQKTFFGPRVLELCREADIVFIALHGENGENGKVQASFDLEGIKYTGSGYLGCAIAMDKGLTKTMFLTAEIPTPMGSTISKKDFYRDYHYTGISVPCVVKPCCGGSSIGVTIVEREEDFDEAVKQAFTYEDEIVVEEYIDGREFSVGVLDGRVLPVIEIAPKDGFYDYSNKYKEGSTVETCPADLPENVSKEMQRYAKEAAETLGLDTYCRMDFMLSKDGKIYCLEANTLPGMTPVSLLPQEAAAVGINYNELVEKIIEVSLKRF